MASHYVKKDGLYFEVSESEIIISDLEERLKYLKVQVLEIEDVIKELKALV